MIVFVQMTDKPRLYRAMGMWLCAGIRLRWGVHEDVRIGTGATPLEAYLKWKRD